MVFNQRNWAVSNKKIELINLEMEWDNDNQYDVELYIIIAWNTYLVCLYVYFIFSLTNPASNLQSFFLKHTHTKYTLTKNK